MKLKASSKHKISPMLRATVKAKSGKLNIGNALQLAPELGNLGKVTREIRKSANKAKK